MSTVRISGGFAAVVLLGLSVPAAAVQGSVSFEYRNSRTGMSNSQSQGLPVGGNAAFALAEAAVSGVASAGLAQVTSQINVSTLGSPYPQQFLDSIGSTAISLDFIVIDAPASAGFLEIAFTYGGTITSELPRPSGLPFSVEALSSNVFSVERTVRAYNSGYGVITYVDQNGYPVPIYTWVPGNETFRADSSFAVYDAIGSYFALDTMQRTIFEQSGFESGQIFRIPFLTGRNMEIRLDVSCQVRTQDQRLFTAAGTCSQSLGWGGLLGASDLDGNAIALDQLNLQGYRADFGNTIRPLDFDPYANLSGIAFTPIPVPTTGAVPEPANWALLIAGFGLIGGVQRRARRASAAVN